MSSHTPSSTAGRPVALAAATPPGASLPRLQIATDGRSILSPPGACVTRAISAPLRITPHPHTLGEEKPMPP
jgi:hypothetical protein